MARTLPQYKCIEGDLLEQIQAGVYKKGDHIPPEQTLSRQYGVSRVTVRKALENLVEQGILKRTPGAGTFVEKLPLTGKLPGLIGFSEEMKAQGLAPSTRVTEFRLETADAATARRLRIADGAPVFFFRRAQYADGELFMLEATHMSAVDFSGISVEALQNGKYRYFEEVLGLPIAYNHHVAAPAPADAQVARAFGIEEGTPVQREENTTYLEDGRVMDFTVQFYNPTRYRLEYYRKR